jgi:hypothetical protein
MSDRATPNLPARDFDVTERFYRTLGFKTSWRDRGWMILKRGKLSLEFFQHPDLEPSQSSFSCCLRLDDLDAFYSDCVAAGIPEKQTGYPRLRPPVTEAWGGRVGALIDCDCTLLRLIQN